MKELFFILFALYGLSTIGRSKHPDAKKLMGWSYAHRGLHNKEAGIPEDKDYLTDFLEAVETRNRELTRDVLLSTETALKIQQIADKEGSV